VLGAFWQSVGGRLADRWATAVLSPICTVWVGGILIWLARLDRKFGGAGATIRALSRDMKMVPAAVVFGCLLAGLIVIILSGFAVQASARTVLRILEGYWPPILDPLARRLRSHYERRASDVTDRLRELAANSPSQLSATDLAERARLQRLHHRTPVQRSALMPTRLGNTLRASEARTRNRYGLDPMICWPRLWLLLPESSKSDVTAAYSALCSCAQWFVASLLLMIWIPWSWWALPAGLLVAFIAYSRLPAAAESFGEVIESCFDVHRGLLYQAVRWPRPTSPQDERKRGAQLNTYLYAGSSHAAPIFDKS
jgi:hypothetical protein